jgi:hypothetical protein
VVRESELSRPKVFFAGIAYLGGFEFIDANYPQALRLNRASEREVGQLDGLLKTKLEQKPPQQFQLEYGLANLYESESVVMAVAIDKELVSVEQYDLKGHPQQKVIVEASAQVLFYDFDSMSLLANYPQALAINHLLPVDAPNFDAEVNQLFATLYLGGNGQPGFIDRIGDSIQAMSVKAIRGFRFQLRNVNTAESVAALLPDGLSQNQFNQYLGQFFSAQLSGRYPIPVLPFIKGYALGNQLPGRFANGQVFNLQFPEPDFVFDMDIKKLVKGQDENGLLYGAQMGFGFYERDLNREIAADDFRYGVYKIDGGDNSLVDDWSAYEDALENLLTELVQQLNSPSRDWFKGHARNADTSYKNFRNKKELFDEYLR